MKRAICTTGLSLDARAAPLAAAAGRHGRAHQLPRPQQLCLMVLPGQALNMNTIERVRSMEEQGAFLADGKRTRFRRRSSCA
jgi:hypothetical protein